MNALTFPLLRFLSDGCYRDVDEIVGALKVSAKEVEEVLEEVRSLGGEVEFDTAGKCRLRRRLAWLDKQEIEQCLGKQSSAFRIEVVDHTGSTNDDLMMSARQGGASGLVRAAELQTAGRGRRQRTWHSGFGGALTFSLLWVFDRGPAALYGLSLVVGVSLLRSLRAVGVPDVMLKWPNDVLWRQRKVGGVLIESSGSISEAARAVIGIGLNLHLSGTVVDRIDQAASDLHTAGLCVGRNQLLGQVLLDLREVLDTFSRDGFAPFKAEWEHAHAYQDKMVQIAPADGKKEEGRVIGVDDDGALLLSVDGKPRRYHGGEVSMRSSGA